MCVGFRVGLRRIASDCGNNVSATGDGIVTKTTYRGGLPKPDRRGDMRPEISGVRFKVGNVKQATETQMLHRMNTLKDVFKKQAATFQVTAGANG